MEVRPQSAPAEGGAGAVAAGLEAELPRLRAFLARRLGRGAVAGAEVEDLVQETTARALRYGHAYDAGRPLGPWLRRTALRALADLRGRAGREPALDAPPLAPPTEPAAPEAGDGLAQREQLARLLAHLTAVERDVLLRFHREGRAVREIAAALGCPENTVKSHLHRARRKLARLAPEEGGP